MDAPNLDYSTGVPRQHHSLYISDGNFVIQVENAIFKIHQSFLERYSSVLRDMLNAPRGTDERHEGTDENPLRFPDDNAEGWQLLLEDIYARQPLRERHPYSGEQLLSILSIAHKYCMEPIEEIIIERLKNASNTSSYIDLMVASRVVGSDSFYKTALQGLVSSNPKPDLAQARRIGLDAYHAVIASTNVGSQPCRHCNFVVNWVCINCERYQH